MIKRIALCLAIVVSLGESGASAQINAASTDGAYQQRVQAAFKAAYAPQVVARVVIEPSEPPDNEYAVGLRNDQGAYSIVSLRSPVRIWTYSEIEIYQHGDVVAWGPPPERANITAKTLADLKASVPADPATVVAATCTAPIEVDLGRQLATVWSAALTRLNLIMGPGLSPAADQVWPPAERAGFDGTNYYFTDSKTALKLWSPSAGGPDDALVHIAETMKSLCAKPDAAAQAGLKAELEALTRQLKI